MAGQYYDSNGNVIDFYIIFNLPYDAAEDQIKSAFRALIKRYHPDTVASSFRESNHRARSTLSSAATGSSPMRTRAGSMTGRSSSPGRSPRRELHGGSEKAIRYSASLGGPPASPSRCRKTSGARTSLYNFGQDVEIFVTAIEATEGRHRLRGTPGADVLPAVPGRREASATCAADWDGSAPRRRSRCGYRPTSTTPRSSTSTSSR